MITFFKMIKMITGQCHFFDTDHMVKMWPPKSNYITTLRGKVVQCAKQQSGASVGIGKPQLADR